MSDKKQIPGLPVATEAKDNDRLIKRDMDSGSDESLEVSLLDDRANARGFAQSVDSVSTLRASTFPASLERLWLSGYYGVGTAGGGPLYRDSADTTTADNGGTVFVDGDGVRWKRESITFVTPEMFGAQPDDDTFDDREAIQGAIDTGLPVVGAVGKQYNVKSTHPTTTASGKTLGIVLYDQKVSDISMSCDVDCDGAVGTLVGQHITIERLGINKNSANVTCGLFLNEEYCPYSWVSDCIIGGDFTHGILMASFVSIIQKVSVNGADNGFSIVNPGYLDTPDNLTTGGTSLSFVACYALNNSVTGWFANNIDYSAFHGCACDHSRQVFKFERGSGVEITGQGAENCWTFMTVAESLGVSVRGLKAVQLGSTDAAGAPTTPPDYFFEFSRISSSGGSFTITAGRIGTANAPNIDFLKDTFRVKGHLFGFPESIDGGYTYSNDYDRAIVIEDYHSADGEWHIVWPNGFKVAGKRLDGFDWSITSQEFSLSTLVHGGSQLQGSASFQVGRQQLFNETLRASARGVIVAPSDTSASHMTIYLETTNTRTDNTVPWITVIARR